MSKKPVLSQSLRDRIMNTTTIRDTSTLLESKFFKPKDFVHTGVPMIDVALSGEVDGGLSPGVLMIAGPSKHFKTGFMLLMAASFLRKYDDGIVLFYDSEFGSPQSYFEAYGIPLDRVIHTPITDVEEAKHDLVTQLQGLTDKDHVMICMDSIGNLASKKEVEDAIEGKSVADMTRAKALKSLFRMITPHLTMKAIPLVCVNHSYKTIEMYSKDVVGGGTGAYYGANDIWILGRQQETQGDGKNKEYLGFRFVINVEKSRTVKEKSKIPIYVSYDDGIHRWSGLWDLAVEFGLIVPAEKANTFVVLGQGQGPAFKRIDTENAGPFWNALFAASDFRAMIKEKYKLQTDRGILGDEDSEVMDLETGEVT